MPPRRPAATVERMAAPSAEDLQAARARLRGQVVATPLIGGVLLPGRVVPAGLRVKPEVLQPAGSIHYRGATHWLLRQLGACKGLALQGSERAVLAAAVAASQHRVPTLAFPVGEPAPAVWKVLSSLQCEVRPRPTPEAALASAEEVRAAEGYRIMPGVEDPDYAAGVATVGCELAAELSAECRVAVVAPGALAPALALGLAAGGADLRVHGIDERAPDGLAEEVRDALRLDIGPASAAALHWALEHEAQASPCVVLSE